VGRPVVVDGPFLIVLGRRGFMARSSSHTGVLLAIS
jgi:hypothetical protein